MAKRTRVERWAEGLRERGPAGRELPPAEVLAADQRVTAWAQELRKAGLEGGMDALRARAYLDILLGTDSRPLGSSPAARPPKTATAYRQGRPRPARSDRSGPGRIRPGSVSRGPRPRPGRWPG